MQFKGREKPDGSIELRAQRPPTCAETLQQRTQVWVARLVYTALVFGLGWLVGTLTH